MKISVLTPSFNSGKYIKRAIESVLIQNYSDFEHIIVDSDSYDDTVSIIQEYPHIKLRSEKDSGQSEAMNKAFNMSSGGIIVYLNADDEFLPGAFDAAISAFQANKDADMIIGNLIFKSATESSLRIPSIRYTDVLQYWLNLFPNNPVSYFYKRKVQEQIGEFPVDDHYSMDIWFILKVYKQFKVVKIDATLGIFHSDGYNKTAIADLGQNLHNATKNHLINDNPWLLLFFYYKLLLGRLK
ncbi:glycosyltransferase family 2 protein [Pedobacter rhodius]|uniref:Glycosyltransferase family 2 protein n=1 Tax=Pedobacter rhodius TaxID=3004098 RepID=A0ABT4KT03_9SPHI|nr:glycosyltransferase family 2 protein [Pedobacter sp. SJ11]MCZ4222068.1 glycosyltransferase family 2 protein [Pedobacter sp. SJ11]